MNKEKKAKLAALEAKRCDQQRRRLYRSLVTGQVTTHDPPHTVIFQGQPIQISQLEYLWLLVRNHLRDTYNGPSIVIDDSYIEVHPNE